MEYTYIFEKYSGPSTKKICPKCGKKTFVRYVDESGNYLHTDVGRCDREEKCGFHYKPKDFFTDNRIEPTRPLRRSRPKEPEKISFMDQKYLGISMKHFQDNNLFEFLPFEDKAGIFNKYYVGSAKHWTGSTCFWYVDADKCIRSGKIMLYDADTGKRVKDPKARITWVHSVLKLPDYSFKYCLFGEHLIGEYPDKTVAIVESEKTALIADHFYPHLLWMACGALGNISDNMLKPLKNRRILLYPDAGKAYNIWCEKADYLHNIGYDVRVSDLLERFADDQEKGEGLDLADFLLKDHLFKHKIEQYILENPSYPDCCDALGIPMGEPLVLDTVPF